MRVSALVTTFNHAAYIEAALDGLLAQSHPDIEIIVVDDRSTDGTPERIAPYVDKGVKLFRSTGDGPSRTMNVALSHATGDILMLQSGDDVSLPNRAAVQCELLSRADVTFSMPFLIDRAGALLPDSALDLFGRRVAGGREALFRSLVLDSNFVCASSVSLTRSAWAQVGAFDEGLLQLQDYEYWLRALCLGCEVVVGSQRVALYRWHGSNLSDQANDARTQHELSFILRRLVETAPEALLSAVHYGVPAELKGQSTPRELLNALVLMRHRSALVRQGGADILIRAMGRADFEQTCASVPLQRAALFQTILNR